MEVSLMDSSRSTLLLQTCTVSALALVLVAASGAGVLAQEQAGSPFGLGRTPTPAELLAWDISIGPAGDELPEGSGSVGEGAGVYSQRGCSANIHSRIRIGLRRGERSCRCTTSTSMSTGL